MPGSATNNLYDLRPKPVPIPRHTFLVEIESQGGDALRGYLGRYTSNKLYNFFSISRSRTPEFYHKY